MQNLTVTFVKSFWLLLLLSIFSTMAQAQSSFTYEGRLFTTAGLPVLESVSVKFQILNPAGTCVLYEEVQSGVDLTATKGAFSLSVGSAASDAKRSANFRGAYNPSMISVFRNSSTLSSIPVAGCAAGTYTSGASDTRLLRVEVTKSGTTEVLSPDLVINAVANAQVAQSLQGYLPSDFLRLDAANGISGNIGLTAIGTGAGQTREFRFYELAANGSDYFALKAPDAMTTALTYVFPSGSPTVGQILSASAPAAGVVTLSWTNDAGAGGGITNFNGSNQSSQSFAAIDIAAAITAPAWSTNVGTGAHTLQIPMAIGAGVTGGLITKVEHTAFTAKVDRAGDTMTGNLSLSGTAGIAITGTGTIAMGTNKITALADPTANQEAATKAYVDSVSSTAAGNYVLRNGTVPLTANWSAGAFTISANGFATSAQAGLAVSPYNTAAGQTGEVRLLELAANGTNYVGFKAPDDAGASNLVYRLPATAPTAGQVLTAAVPAAGVSDLSWGTTSGTLSSLTAGRIPYAATATSLTDSANLSFNATTGAISLGGTAPSITSGDAITIAAGGTNKNVVLTPSGTGFTLLSGNVGIGTATPSENLQIQGDTSLGSNWVGSTTATNAYVGIVGVDALLDVVSVNNGSWGSSVNLKEVASDNSTYTDAWSIVRQTATGDRSLRFTYGTNTLPSSNTAMMTLLTSGNVGIGTATPAYKLDVAGELNLANILYLSTAEAVKKFGTWLYINGNNDFTSGTYIPGSLRVDTNLTVTSANSNFPGNGIWNTTGNVGIGTTSPDVSLAIQNALHAEVKISTTDANSDSRLSLIGGGTQWQLQLDGNSTYGIDNAFHIIQDTSSRLVIDTSGNVGIGTTLPLGMLHTSGGSGVPANIVADSFADSSSSGFTTRHAGGTRGSPSAIAAADTVMGGFNARGYGTTGYSANAATYVAFFSSQAWTDAAQGAYISFATTPSNSTVASRTERMRISDAGNIGIGAGAPVDLLSIATAVNASATRASLNLSNTALVGGSANGTYLGANPAAFTGNFIDLQVAGASKFRVDKDGKIYGDGSTISNLAGGSSTVDGLSDARTDYASIYHISIGSGAGANLTAGSQQNVFVGQDAGNTATTADFSTGVGYEALKSFTTGEYATAFGTQALRVSTGNYNTAVGAQSMAASTTAVSNTALGMRSMYANLTGNLNTAIGAEALANLTSGSLNVGVGYKAVYSNQTADDNIGIGQEALYAATGGQNIAIGRNAGDNITTGNNNIVIGNNLDAPVATSSNQLNIGNTIYGDTSAGKIGIGDSSPDTTLKVVGSLCVKTDANNCSGSTSGVIYATTASVTGADYAEYFSAEEKLEKGQIVGLSSVSGLARAYRSGDRVLGIVSSNPGVVGNTEIHGQVSVLVALMGQVPFKQDEVRIKNNFAMTLDGQPLGYILANGHVYINIGSTSPSSRDIASELGLPLPRMSKATRDALIKPQQGTAIYQTDQIPGLRVFNGKSWTRYSEITD